MDRAQDLEPQGLERAGPQAVSHRAAGLPRGEGIILDEPITTRERLLLGVALSFLLHGLLLTSAVLFAPRLAGLLGAGRSATTHPEQQVLTFQFKDETADVSPSSKVDKAVPTPLLGQFNSKARDRIVDAHDTPVPLGGEVADENSLPGRSGEQGAPTAATGAGPGTQPTAANPEGARNAYVADKPSSEVAMLTGREAPRTFGRDGHGARRRTDQGDAGALEFGDYAFSTTAWDYEPYWHHMRGLLYANWHPPAAYKDYGIITGGWTLVRATIDRKGRVVHAEVLDKTGHPSLHRSSFAAMVGASPFRPLPTNFPDDSLVVTVKFIYLPPGERAPREGP